jgi:hypothetical protein
LGWGSKRAAAAGDDERDEDERGNTNGVRKQSGLLSVERGRFV